MYNHRLKFMVFHAILFLMVLRNGHSQDRINPNSIDSYVSYIKGVRQSPKDYILQLFDSSDIVIICERFHPEFTQYEMILDLIRDKRFIDKVGNIFTEKGSVTNNPALSNLMSGLYSDENKIEDELLRIYRNLDYDYIWNKYPMYYFLQQVVLLNNSLPYKKKINFFFTGMPFNWNEITKEKYDKFKKTLPKRDKMMADFIIQTFGDIIESKQIRKKALVIMNYRHAFNDYDYNDGRNRDNVGRYLFEKYPGKVSNVMINSVAILPGSTDPNPITATIQGGKWDAAFKFAGNPSIGFDFKNSPFGKDTFDFYPMHNKAPTYQDIFTGFVFYKPLNEHRLIYGIPGLCEDGFDDILWERYKIIGLSFNKKFKKSITTSEERIREFKYDDIEKYEASINNWLMKDSK